MISNVSLSFAIPADVRAAGTDAVKNYKAAAGFEQMLASQLVKAMTDNSPLGEGPFAVQMQDTLSTALVSGRGLGLAQQLYKEMQS